MTAPSEAVRRHILGWADDEFILGHQLGEMVGSYFDLEEAVALGSLAQDHLVHAHELYGLLGYEGTELDRFVFERSPEAFLNSRLVGEGTTDDFAALVVKMALYSVAEELRVRAATSEELLADVSARIASEEAYHREHWWDWMGILGGSDVGYPRVDASLVLLVPLAADFFDLELEGSGTDNPAARWRVALAQRLASVGLALPENLAPDIAAVRRGGHGVGFAESLASLRAVRQPGAKEVTWG